MVLSANTAGFTCLFYNEEMLDDTRTLAVVLVLAADIWAAESGSTHPFVAALCRSPASQHPHFNFARSSNQAKRVNTSVG